MRLKKLFKKLVSLLLAGGIVASCSVGFAAGMPQGAGVFYMNRQNGVFGNMYQMQAFKPSNPGTVQNRHSFKDMKEDAIFKLAAYLGIDTRNLTLDQVVSLIVAKWNEMKGRENVFSPNVNFFGNLNVQSMAQLAEEMGISSGGVQAADILSRIKQNMNYMCSNALLEKAAVLLGIDTDDLDNDEIVAKIEDALDELSAAKLLQLANILGIDPGDLTEDEMVEEIKDALEGLLDEDDTDVLLEKAAAFLGIDTDELDDDEIVSEIKDVLDDLSVSNLIKLANIFGIDTDDLTSDEIIDAIEDILDDM